VSDRALGRANRAVERWLAWRYLATRQREGFVSFIAIFSLIGVALGVATLIIVLSVMGGFEQDLKDKMLRGQPHLEVMDKKNQGDFPAPSSLNPEVPPGLPSRRSRRLLVS